MPIKINVLSNFLYDLLILGLNKVEIGEIYIADRPQSVALKVCKGMNACPRLEYDNLERGGIKKSLHKKTTLVKDSHE